MLSPKIRQFLKSLFHPFSGKGWTASLIFTLLFPLPGWICIHNFADGTYTLTYFLYNISLLLGHSIVELWIILTIATYLDRLSRVVKLLWMGIVYVILILNLIGNMASYMIYHSFPSGVTAALFANSYFLEAVGFLYFCLQNYLVSIIIILILAGVFFFSNIKLWKNISHSVGLQISASIFSIIWVAGAIFISPGDTGPSFFIGKIKLLSEVKEVEELFDENNTLASLDRTEKAPSTIFIIIGESFSRDCSSLYNYDKTTNPQLERLLEDSLLYVFKDARSEAVSTLISFSKFFTATREEKPWNQCENPFEIVENYGYATFWLSNQAQTGFHENMITKLSNRASTSKFTIIKGDIYTSYYDEAVLSLIDETIEPDESALVFIHLMGSHFPAEMRYPADRGRFTSRDYDMFPAAQRKVRAYYDNSVVYNDSVVAEIFKRVEALGGISLYFPDHGEDVCATSDIVRHGDTNDPQSIEAATRIPFMIYLSRAYRDTHPVMRERIEASLDEPVSNTQMIYTLMDFLGVDFADRPVVDSLSAIRPLSHNINQ